LTLIPVVKGTLISQRGAETKGSEVE